MTKLKDIKEFNMLQRNLELTKALQDVDRLKAENVELKEDFKVVKKLYHQQVDEIYKLELEIIKLETSLNTKAQEEAERLKSKL